MKRFIIKMLMPWLLSGCVFLAPPRAQINGSIINQVFATLPHNRPIYLVDTIGVSHLWGGCGTESKNDEMNRILKSLVYAPYPFVNSYQIPTKPKNSDECCFFRHGNSLVRFTQPIQLSDTTIGLAAVYEKSENEQIEKYYIADTKNHLLSQISECRNLEPMKCLCHDDHGKGFN